MTSGSPKLDYQTLEEAEAAAQGYVAGTMEEDGFAYDGAAVYDAETRQCLRVYGDYPDEKAQEQAAAFALEHDTAQQNTAELPAFLDMHLIEANLLDDGGRKHKRQEIFEYFQAHKNLAERTEFLKNSYNDIWVEVLTDGVRTGYHAEKDGLLMWEGSYLSRTSESVFSWSVITEMTEGLIERGEYKIKLGLQNAPIVAEQLALFDMGGDAPVYEAPADTATGILAPARTVPQEVIDLALCTGGNEPNSAERIAVFYVRERPESENISFLRREFGRANGRGIEYEGRKYAVWFLEDGIHLAQGDSVRTGYSKTMVTWEQASARILELLETGTYLSASELAQAPDKVLHEAMDALLMTARDLNEEGRTQGLFPQTLAIHDQHKGYPELDEDIPLWLVTLLGSLFITVLAFIMILTVYGRFFKIYMYAALSPVALASFAGEGTSHFGKAFLRSYVGVCMEGAVIVLACIIFSAFSSSGTPVVDSSASVVTQVWSYLGEVIFNLLVLVGLVKSADHIAKEMLGL